MFLYQCGEIQSWWLRHELQDAHGLFASSFFPGHQINNVTLVGKQADKLETDSSVGTCDKDDPGVLDVDISDSYLVKRGDLRKRMSMSLCKSET